MCAHPLKTYRDSQTPRLTQGGLAKLLGVSRTTVARWEGGKRKVDRDLVQAVSKATGVATRELRPDLAEIFSEAAE